MCSNVCPHRSAVIAEETGNRTVFRCPYHAWTYDPQGRLVGAPHIDKARLDDISLKELRLETRQGLAFVNLDDSAEALAPNLTALEERLAPLHLAEHRVIMTDTLDVTCNWKS